MSSCQLRGRSASHRGVLSSILVLLNIAHSLLLYQSVVLAQTESSTSRLLILSHGIQGRLGQQLIVGSNRARGPLIELSTPKTECQTDGSWIYRRLDDAATISWLPMKNPSSLTFSPGGSSPPASNESEIVSRKPRRTWRRKSGRNDLGDGTLERPNRSPPIASTDDLLDSDALTPTSKPFESQSKSVKHRGLQLSARLTSTSARRHQLMIDESRYDSTMRSGGRDTLARSGSALETHRDVELDHPAAVVAGTSNRRNGSGENAQRLMELKQKYKTNRAISDRAYYSLLLLYSLFIFIGTISNSLICLTVILRPKILSPRNIFIVNLAGSDLLLCVFTMPFSFIEISSKMWPMGELPCKLVASLQGTSIFVSTISITAIALDRYKVIVYPTHRGNSNASWGALFCLLAVWCLALVLSFPLFCFRQLQREELPETLMKAMALTQKNLYFCVESWPFNHGRGFYSVASMIFQYLVPITIVSVVYAKISDKLQKRLIRRQKLTQLECQQKRQLSLIRRTHTMLIMVSLLFGLCWLPLNLLNVVSDFSDLFKNDENLFRIVFAICNLIGCSSACSNPILYGFLNENFRKELQQVYVHHWHQWCRLMPRLCRVNSTGQTSSITSTTPTSTSSSPSSSSSTSRTSSGGQITVSTSDAAIARSQIKNLTNCEGRSDESRQPDQDGQIVIMMTENPGVSRHAKQSQQTSSLLVDGHERLKSPVTRIIDSSGVSTEDIQRESMKNKSVLVKLARVFGCVIINDLNGNFTNQSDIAKPNLEESSMIKREPDSAHDSEKSLESRRTRRAVRRKKGKRKPSKRCLCHCHLYVNDDENVIKRTSSTGSRMDSSSHSRSKEPANLTGERRRLSSGDLCLSRQDQPKAINESCRFTTKSLVQQPIGQRVWLRFLPSKQRYYFKQHQESNKRRDKRRNHCSICRISAERRRKERRDKRQSKKAARDTTRGGVLRSANKDASKAAKRTNSPKTPKSHGPSVGQQAIKLGQPICYLTVDQSSSNKRIGTESTATSVLVLSMNGNSIAEDEDGELNALGTEQNEIKDAGMQNCAQSTSDVKEECTKQAIKHSTSESAGSRPSRAASPTSILSSMCLNSSTSSHSICSCMRDCDFTQRSDRDKITRTRKTPSSSLSMGVPEQDERSHDMRAESSLIRRRCYTVGTKSCETERLAKVRALERCCQVRSMASTNCCTGSTMSSITSTTGNQSSEFICSTASHSTLSTTSESSVSPQKPSMVSVISIRLRDQTGSNTADAEQRDDTQCPQDETSELVVNQNPQDQNSDPLTES